MSTSHTLPFRSITNDYQHYEALDPSSKQIRLVAIEPGEGDAEICCTLQYATLDVDDGCEPQYEALSYCWGSLEDPVTISLGHREKLSPPSAEPSRTKKGRKESGTKLSTPQDFRITKSLYGALKSLRKLESSRVLWVDAICINQGNPQERTHQVIFMSEIYARAHEVIVWLGEPTFASAVAFQVVHKANQLRQAYRRKHQKDPPAPRDNRFRMDAGTTELLEEILVDPGFHPLLMKVAEVAYSGETSDWRIEPFLGIGQLLSFPLLSQDKRSVARLIIRCFENLLSRPWFKRVWCVQEVFFAVQKLGERAGRATFVCGSDMAQWMDVQQVALELVVWALDGSDSREGYFHQPKPLYDYMLCWGLMTMTSAEDPRVPILYLLQLTRRLLASELRDKLFAVLALADETLEGGLKNPLIGPDYEKPLRKVLADFVQWHINHSRTLGFFSLIPPPTIALMIEGERVPSWFPDILNLTGFVPKASRDDIYAATVAYTIPSYNAARNTKASFTNPSHPDLLVLRGISVSKILTVSSLEINCAPEFFECVICEDTRYTYKSFRDSLGLEGLCPYSTQPDDIIAILYGGLDVYILRPTLFQPTHACQSNGGSKIRYQFIGNCYFQHEKWMNGEAIEYQRRNNIPTETFELC